MVAPRRARVARLDQPRSVPDAEDGGSPWRALLIVFVALLLFSAVAALGLFSYLDVANTLRSEDATSGWSALWIGDVDADGVPDLALGISSESYWNKVRLVSGADGRVLAELGPFNLSNHLADVVGPLAERGFWWKGQDHTLHLDLDGLGDGDLELDVGLGEAVAPLGDVDGDGALDVLVSGFPKSQTRRVLSAVSTRTGQALWTLSRERSRELAAPPFGWVAAAAGDVDGDGVVDAAVVDERKRVLLVDGRTGTTLRELEQHVDWITGALVPIGDVDGDRAPELALYEAWRSFDRAAMDEPRNALRVVSCATGEVLASHEVEGILFHVHSPGDVDGDGALDLSWFGSQGRAVVRALDGTPISGAVGDAGPRGHRDLDRDGCDDLLVVHNVVIDASIDPPEDLWRQGRIEVVSGRDGTVLFTLDESVLPPR